VRAELVAAQQACDFPENETGWTTPDLFRWLYGADLATAHGKTREQVRAELAAAQRAGDVHIGLGFAPRELYPDNYRQDAQTKAPGRTVAREPGRPSNH
jgi:hypothetical protein